MSLKTARSCFLLFLALLLHPGIWAQFTGWTTPTLPSAISSGGIQGRGVFGGPDGNVYVPSYTGSSPSIVNVLYAINPATGVQTNVTGTGMPGTAGLSQVGMLPNGNLIASFINAGVSSGTTGYNPVYIESGGVWTQVSGWTGVSNFGITQFANDSAGYTYFSPPFTGDIYVNTAPNGSTFTKIVTNIYTTQGLTAGGIYQLWIFNFGDGNGDTMVLGGEGGLLACPLSTISTPVCSFYLNTTTNKGNLTGIASNGTTMLVTKDNATDYPNPPGTAAQDTYNLNAFTNLTSPTKTVTQLTDASIPTFITESSYNRLKWLGGNYFAEWGALQSAGWNSYSGGTRFVILSSNSGSTFTDLTTTVPSVCTSPNSSSFDVVNGYLVLGCKSGGVGYIAISNQIVSSSTTSQTISFTAIPGQTLPGSPITLSATATSGLTVSFAASSGPVTVSGSTATLTGSTGTACITASQAGNGTYSAATPVTNCFTVATAVLANTGSTFGSGLAIH